MTSPIIIALFLALIGERLTQALVTPAFDRFHIDHFWLTYVSWLVTAIVVGLGQVNLLADYVPSPLAGYILTALICGGGSNFIHELFDTIIRMGAPVPNIVTEALPIVPRDAQGGMG